MIEFYAVITLGDWENRKSEYPNAISIGNSKMIQYAVKDSSFLDLRESDEIIKILESGEDFRPLHCDYENIKKVVEHFKGDEDNV